MDHNGNNSPINLKMPGTSRIRRSSGRIDLSKMVVSGPEIEQAAGRTDSATAPVKLKSAPKTLDDAYAAWSARPTEQSLWTVVQKADPIIQSALTTFVGGDSNSLLALRGRHIVAQSIPKYDPKRGVKLRTYLMTQLQQLRRVAAAQSPVYLPERQRQELTLVFKMRQQAQQRLGREPTDRELAEQTSLPVAKIRRALGRLNTSMANESNVMEGGLTALADVSQDEDKDAAVERLITEMARDSLDSTDRAILDMHVDGKSKLAIAKALKISPSTVSKRSAAIADKINQITDDYYRFASEV